MRALWKRFSDEVSAPFLWALVLCAGFWSFVAWDQSHWWRTKADYSFGWLVPAFVVFIIHDRWPQIVAATRACASEGSPRVTGWRQGVLRLGAGASLTGGALLFLLGVFYRAAAGASHPGTQAIALGSAAILLPLLLLNAPGPEGEAATVARGIFDDARVKLTALFLFPALVWLVSAPLLSLMEEQLNLFLLGRVVTVVAFVFDLLGLPIEQQGNVLALPTGNVGVEEACSGIRSLTACLFAGSFLAATFLDRPWKKVTLVAASMLLAFLTNLGRSLFLTAWAYRNGPASIEGTVHDAAGYLVLGLTVAGLLCLLPLLNLRFTAGENTGQKEKAP